MNSVEKCIVDVRRRKCPAGIDYRTVQRRAQVILGELEVGPCELSILLCNDDVIRDLNRDYRHKDNPTDVLSFPMDQDESPSTSPRILGDVVISIDTACRQAAQGNHSLLKETTALLVHGVLHLVGYTHETDADEAKMNGLAQGILKVF